MGDQESAERRHLCSPIYTRTTYFTYANNDDVTAHEALRGGLARMLAAVLSPGGTRPHALSRGLVAVLGVRVVWPLCEDTVRSVAWPPALRAPVWASLRVGLEAPVARLSRDRSRIIPWYHA